jgi:hypothetical protein
MGENSEGITACGRDKNSQLGSCEAHYVGSRSPEDRGVSAGALGEAEGGAEEGGVEPLSLWKSADFECSNGLELSWQSESALLAIASSKFP